MSEALTTAPGQRACLLVGHDGVETSVIDALPEQVPGLQVAGDVQTAVLGALMRCWQTIDQFGPLKGHREGAQTLGPQHPWYGADRSDPGQLAEQLGPALLAPALWGKQASGPICLVSRQVFWTWNEIRDYCRFFLLAMPDSRLILARGPAGDMAESFATRAGWSRTAAREAIAQMEQHMNALAEAWPDRCVDWDVRDPASAVAVAAAFAGAEADTSATPETGQTS